MYFKEMISFGLLLIFSICSIVLFSADFPSDEQIVKIVTSKNDVKKLSEDP